MPVSVDKHLIEIGTLFPIGSCLVHIQNLEDVCVSLSVFLHGLASVLGFVQYPVIWFVEEFVCRSQNIDSTERVSVSVSEK